MTQTSSVIHKSLFPWTPVDIKHWCVQTSLSLCLCQHTHTHSVFLHVGFIVVGDFLDADVILGVHKWLGCGIGFSDGNYTGDVLKIIGCLHFYLSDKHIKQTSLPEQYIIIWKTTIWGRFVCFRKLTKWTALATLHVTVCSEVKTPIIFHFLLLHNDGVIWGHCRGSERSRRSSYFYSAILQSFSILIIHNNTLDQQENTNQTNPLEQGMVRWHTFPMPAWACPILTTTGNEAAVSWNRQKQGSLL